MLTGTSETCLTMPSPEATVHVLALDDDPSVRQMIADYLTDNDIRVTVIESGKEIADVMARHRRIAMLLWYRQHCPDRKCRR